MNKHNIFLIAGISILITLLFPPFEIFGKHGTKINKEYSFILMPPSHGDFGPMASVNINLLLTQWVGIILITLSAYLFLMRRA